MVAVDGVEVLDSLRLQLRNDTTDTWTFHTDRWEEQGTATLGGDDWQIEETGPLRVRARLDGRLGNSRVRLTVSLCRGEPALHLGIEVNFDERYTLLQMPMALAGEPERWTDGIAGACIDRAPSPAEWPYLGWSRRARRRARRRAGDERLLQPQRRRRLLDPDAPAQPADGLGRRQPQDLRRPRPAQRPGRPPLRLHPRLRGNPLRRRDGRPRWRRRRSPSSSSTATRE